jgi:hypothetical protein
VPDRAMLDVSMILHRDSLNHLLGLAGAGGLENLVIANSLVRLAEQPDEFVARMTPFLGMRRRDTDLVALRRLLPIIIGGISRFSAAETDRPSVPPAFALAGRDMAVSEVLYEEWLFLTTQSWLFAKLRTTFDRMIDAGAVALQMSRAQFEKVVRRTIKKSTGPLSPNDKALAAAKWLAVSGPPVWAVLEPISGTAGTVLSGIFLLCDP